MSAVTLDHFPGLRSHGWTIFSLMIHPDLSASVAISSVPFHLLALTLKLHNDNMLLLTTVLLLSVPFGGAGFFLINQNRPGNPLRRAFVVNGALSASIKSTFSQLRAVTDSLEAGVHVAERLFPSVVLVKPTGVRNITARGSGFFVDWKDEPNGEDGHSYIVTAAHVAVPGWQLELELGDLVFPASVVGRNSTLDLALLKTDYDFPPDSRPPALSFAPQSPKVGSISFAIGYPASKIQGPAITSGIVCGIAQGLGIPESMYNGFVRNDTNTQYVVTDAAMSGGMSGGPLVDRKGRVLGVDALVRPDLRALGNYAVSAQELQAFLEQLKNTSDGEKEATTYRVALFNDNMNKKERVRSILEQVASMESAVADKVMMQAHSTGRGIIQTGLALDDAKDICEMLREQDILVEVEADR